MKKRVITGIGMVLVAIPCLILGGWASTILFFVIAVLSFWELLKIGKEKNWPIGVYIIASIFGLAILLWPFIIEFKSHLPEFVISIPENFEFNINFILVLSFLLAILTCEVASHNFFVNDALYVFTMILFVSTACQVLMFIRLHFGLFGIGYIFLLSFICDCFAHLVGSRWGKKKLAPTLSPKKTWLGALAGVVGATLFGWGYYLLFPFLEQSYAPLIMTIASLLLAIGAVIGDLIFSSIKRQIGIKDFSEIFPGHGGMLDRVDSLLFNTLLFICFYSIVVQGLNIILS